MDTSSSNILSQISDYNIQGIYNIGFLIDLSSEVVYIYRNNALYSTTSISTNGIIYFRVAFANGSHIHINAGQHAFKYTDKMTSSVISLNDYYTKNNIFKAYKTESGLLYGMK